MNDLDDFDNLPAVPDNGELAPYAPGGTDWLPASTGAGADYLPDLSRHGQHSAGPPTVFGQQAAPGVTAEAVQRDLATLDSYFAQAMRQQGVSPSHTELARAWFRRAAAGTVPREWPAHGYDLARFSFARADMPYVNSFANMAHKARMPEAVVYRMLTWYSTLMQRLQQAQQQQQQQAQAQQPTYGPTLDTISDHDYQLVMRRADSDKCAGRDELRKMWGNEFAPRLRVVQQYFAGLPAAERDYLESAVVQGGMLAANSADFIDRVYRHAIGSMPTGGALAAEIAQLEQRMRTDRKNWMRDEKAQLRLRALYEQRDG